MLEFSSEQLGAMLAQWRRSSAWRLTLICKDLWPQQVEPLGRDGAYQRILALIDDGMRIGLRAQDDLLRFIGIAVALGWNYASDAEHAWIVRLLEDTDVGPPSFRLRTVLELLRDR